MPTRRTIKVKCNSGCDDGVRQRVRFVGAKIPLSDATLEQALHFYVWVHITVYVMEVGTTHYRGSGSKSLELRV